MNFSINSFGKLIALILISIFIIFIYIFNELYTNTTNLKELQNHRHNTLLKANEFRQYMNNLTDSARMYTISSDIAFRNDYYKILDTKSKKNYSDIENIIKNSRLNSLLNLELKSFKLMDEGKQKKAIKLLHSQKYSNIKNELTNLVEEFITSTKKNSAQSIEIYNKNINNLFKKIFVLIVFGLFVFLASLFVLRKKVLMPIHMLTRAILSYKTGGKRIEAKVIYNDEIGMMTQQFFSMQKKLDEKYEALKRISLTDHLTGIKNRRSFFEISEEYMKLALRHKKDLSLIILDIDHFKKVNDTYGHLIGDEILKFITKNVQISLRESDIFARYGGEEFVILLPDTDIENCLHVANKIRLHIETTHYRDSELDIKITVSIGAKQLEDEKLLRELIHNADEALYRAKENGRNRVEHA